MNDPNEAVLLAIGRLEGKMDAVSKKTDELHVSQTELAAKIESKHDQLEQRVSSLERSRAWLHGASTIGGAMLGFIGNHLWPKS